MRNLIGNIVGGRFQVIQKIGSGSLSSVFLADDLFEEYKNVAIKILRSDQYTPYRSEQFKNECSMMAHLRHPNLGRFCDFGFVKTASGSISESTMFLAYEYIEGVELLKYFNNSDQSLDTVLKLTHQICLALQYIHSFGLVHLDVKPANILVRETNKKINIKLIDFGLAAFKSGLKKPLIRGSAPYMAPELIRNEKADHRADLYSLGITLYEMIAGKLPFERDEPHVTFQKHLKEHPRELKEISPWIPNELNRCVMSLLQKKPRDRIRNANDVIRELNPIGHLSILPDDSDQYDYSAYSFEYIGGKPRLKLLSDNLKKNSSVIVTGGPGSGKTRLIQELRRQANARGLTCLMGKFQPAPSRILPPLHTILNSALPAIQNLSEQEPGNRSLKTLKKQCLALINFVTSTNKIADLPTKKTDIIQRFCDFFLDLTLHNPLLLVIEDLHYSDALSIELIDALLHTIATASHKPEISVIITCRKVIPSEYISNMLTKQLERDHLQQIQLLPLTQDEIQQWLISSFGALTHKQGFAQWLEGSTGSNPYFIQEMIQKCIQDKALRNNHGNWKLDKERLQEIQIPISIENALETRISNLTHWEKKILDIISLAGDWISLNVVLAVSDIDNLNFYHSIEVLWQRDLIRITTTNSITEYRIYHDVIGKLVTDTMEKKHKVTLHRSIAEKLIDEQAVVKSQDAAVQERIACHYLAAKSRKSFPHVTAVVRVLNEKHAFEKSNELLDKALALKPGFADKKNLLELRIQSVMETGDTRSALTDIQKLRSFLKDKRIEMSKEFEMIESRCNFELGNLDESKTIVDKLLKEIAPDDNLDIYLRSAYMKIRILAFKGDIASAQSIIDTECEKLLKANNNTLTFAKFLENCAHMTMDMVVSTGTDFTKIEKYNHQARLIFERLNFKTGIIKCLRNEANIAFRKNDLSSAVKLIRKSIRLANAQGSKMVTFALNQTLAHILEQQSKFKEALEKLLPALAYAQRFNLVDFEAKLSWTIGGLYGRYFKLDKAVHHMNHAIQMFIDTGSPYLAARVRISLSEAYLMSGEFEASLEQITATREQFKKMNQVLPAYAATIMMTYSLRSLGRYEEIFELMEEIKEPVKKTGDLHLISAMHEANAAALTEYGRYTDALMMHHKIVKNTTNTHLDNFLCNAHLNISDLQILNGNYEGALQHIALAEKLLSDAKMFQQNQFFQITFYLMVTLNQLQKAEKITAKYEKTIKSIYSSSNLHLAQLWIQKARLCLAKREFEQAVKHTDKAINYAECSGKAKIAIGLVFLKLTALTQVRKFKEIKAVFKTYHEDMKNLKRPEQIARKKLILGIIAREVDNEIRKSTELFNESLKITEQHNLLNLEWEIYSELLYNAELSQKPLECKRLIEKADAIFSRIESVIPVEYLPGYRSQWKRAIYDERKLIHRNSMIEQSSLPEKQPLQNTSNQQSMHVSQLNRMLQKLHGIIADHFQDHDGLLKKFVYETIIMLEAERGMIFQANGNNSLTVRIAMDHQNKTLTSPSDFSLSIPGNVIKTGRSTVLEGTSSNTSSMDEYGLRSVLCVPIRTTRNALGVLYIDSTAHIRKFSNEDLQLLETVCRHLGLYMENAWLWEERLNNEKSKQKILETKIQQLQEAISPQKSLIGHGHRFQDMMQKIKAVAQTDVSVLLLGETGVGKECAAHAVHDISNRKSNPFIVIDCTSIPENLLESELFGHEKGSFTSASHRKIGKFELADSGTVFLDEIGDLPMNLQGKLLRVIEERTFQRIGGKKPIKTDVRFVAATNRDLAEMVKNNQFRQDLYYRLNVITVTIPPLRERTEDIEPMVNHFVSMFSRKYHKDIKGINPDALQLMKQYDWPGNIRELINRIQRGVIMSHRQWITPEDLNFQPTDNSPAKAKKNDLWLNIQSHLDCLIDNIIAGESLILWDDCIKPLQNNLIHQAVELTSGNKTRAADLLGIDRRKLGRYIENHEPSQTTHSEVKSIGSILESLLKNQQHSPQTPPVNLLNSLESMAIQQTLNAVNQNHRKAQDILGISRYLLLSKINQSDNN